MSDASIQNAGLPKLKQILKTTARDIYRTTLRAALYTVAWRWLVLVAVLFALDLVFGLPVFLRWLGLAGQIVFLLMGVRAGMQSRTRIGRGDEWAARVV